MKIFQCSADKWESFNWIIGLTPQSTKSAQLPHLMEFILFNVPQNMNVITDR